MKRVGLVLVAAVAVLAGLGRLADMAFGEGGQQRAAQAAAPTTEPSVDEQFVAEVEDAVTGEEAGFGQRAVPWVEAMCDALDTFSATDDPQPGVDLLLDASFEELGWPADASATVLHIGVSHFCPEHRAAVSSYIARRDIVLGY